MSPAVIQSTRANRYTVDDDVGYVLGVVAVSISDVDGSTMVMSAHIHAYYPSVHERALASRKHRIYDYRLSLLIERCVKAC